MTWKVDKNKIKKRLYNAYGKASIQKIDKNKVKISYKGGDSNFFWEKQLPKVIKQFPQYQFN